MSGLVAPVRTDEHEAGRRRWAEHVEEQPRAVLVAPLEIVDEDDDARAVGDASEELLKREKCAPLPLVGVGCQSSASRCRDRFDPSEHREHARQRVDVSRQERRHLARREPAQMPAQRIHDGVHGFERQELALVAASAQHEPAVPVKSRIEEPLHESRLAHPRKPLHEDDHGPAVADSSERLAEQGERLLAPDEWRPLRRARQLCLRPPPFGRTGRRSGQPVCARSRRTRLSVRAEHRGDLVRPTGAEPALGRAMRDTACSNHSGRTPRRRMVRGEGPFASRATPRADVPRTEGCP